MFLKLKNKIKSTSGFTLIELILSISLIMFVLIGVYNFIFVSRMAYNSVKEQNLMSMKMEGILTQLDKEIKEAQKAMENDDVLITPSETELILFTDIINDKRPEKVRYRVKNSNLYKSFALPNNDVYPYIYQAYGAEKIVLENVSNNDVFTDVEPVDPEGESEYRNKDYRRKIKIHLVLDDSNNSGENFEIESYFMTKSKAHADAD